MGNGNQKQDEDRPVEIMAHIQTGASAEDDFRYRNLAQAYLGFEPSRDIVDTAPPNSGEAQSLHSSPAGSLVAKTPVYAHTGYIGPTHVGSMSTPPAAQGSAPTQASVPSAGSRGLFTSQPVFSAVEVAHTPVPFSLSQGDTPTHQSLDFSSPTGPSGTTMTPAPGGCGNKGSTDVSHISETPRASTVIPETPQGQSSQFQPSSLTANFSMGSSVIGNPNSPRPVDLTMGYYTPYVGPGQL
ncbi:hypothetical protein PG994_009695 [Apiospora phragmitis]|uniref:Uncharacterized protein n=1 Tax=Apiospora phragmitis TaxID=2905665 RepID=A0ABR1U6U1_9PEZI